MARFANGKAPFLRVSDSKAKGTGAIMADFLIALVPVVAFAWFKNGIMVYAAGDTTFWGMLYPLFFILAGGLLSTFMECIFFYTTDKEVRSWKKINEKLKTSYSSIPGLLLALILPMYTPFWVLMFGVFMGTIVGKMLFGGFGNNVFNPALVGYIAIVFTMPALTVGSALNPTELLDSVAGATPLNGLSVDKIISYDALVKPYGSLWNFFWGTIPGAIGETSAFVMLLSYVWLVARKVIKWSTPIIYIGSVFVLSWLIGLLSGVSGVWFPLYSILSGGLFFGAIFMATEPVTTPRNPLGKIVYALFLGVLTVLFRYVGNLPEGVATALIAMNLFTMSIDRQTAILRSTGLKKQTLLPAGVLFGILALLMLYTVFKAGTMYNLSAVILGFGRF